MFACGSRYACIGFAALISLFLLPPGMAASRHDGQYAGIALALHLLSAV